MNINTHVVHMYTGYVYNVKIRPLSLPVPAPATPRPRRTVDNWFPGQILISRYTCSTVGAHWITIYLPREWRQWW